MIARNVCYNDIITYACNFGNYYTNQESVGEILLHINQASFESLVYESSYEFSWCAILNGSGEILAESGEKLQKSVNIWIQLMIKRKMD